MLYLKVKCVQTCSSPASRTPRKLYTQQYNYTTYHYVPPFGHSCFVPERMVGSEAYPDADIGQPSDVQNRSCLKDHLSASWLNTAFAWLDLFVTLLHGSRHLPIKQSLLVPEEEEDKEGKEEKECNMS